MAEQWELCKLDADYVYFYNPKVATQFVQFKDYLKRYDAAFKSRGKSTDRSLVISKLLSEFWQPYASDEHIDSFRRKYPE